MLDWPNPVFGAGKTVVGKWNRRPYQIERELGEGANGKVYLVSHNQSFYAMKVGADPVDMQAEVNVLQALSAERGPFYRFLIDVDDVDGGQRAFPFYVMKYVKGVQLQQFLRAKGQDWFPLIGLRLLQKLSELHQRGWVFGDLKRENVLVSGYADVELVDYGGVTPMGRAVKQFTEVYDRGYWDAGLRVAEPSYDLFSFALLCIQSCGEKLGLFDAKVLPQNRTLNALKEVVRLDDKLKPYAPFLKKALSGGYSDAESAVKDWRQLVRSDRLAPGWEAFNGKHSLWLKTSFAAALAGFVVVLFYYRS